MSFIVHRKLLVAALAGFGIVSLLSLPARVIAQQRNKPNILFLEVDDLNYKYVHQLGCSFIKTPNIDALARAGVYFRNAMCQGMMCGPSRNSLITGLYPHNLGFYRNGQMGELPHGVWSFPAALQRAGYYTAWIGKSHIHPPGARSNPAAMETELGFNHVQKTLGRAMLGSGKSRPGDWYFEHLQKAGLLEKFRREFPHPSTLPEDDYLDGFFTRAVLDFLDRYDHRQPLFLWVNYSLPHGPYDVSREYHDLYSTDIMPGVTKAHYQVPPNLVKDTKPVRTVERAKQNQAGFCAAITFLDRQIGRILKKLDQQGMRDNTMIVFFSDHGIMMGDHERFHKGTLFRQVTNPTLIISQPLRFRTGTTVDAPVELRDILDTCLDLADAPPADRGKYPGYSLLPLLTGKGTFQRKYAFGEIEGYAAVTDGRYRLIKGKDVTLLFDEQKDRDDLWNIASQYPQVVARLSAALDTWREKTGPALPPQRKKRKAKKH